MAYKVKGAAWNYLGSKDVSDCSTAEEVMEKAGLNYTVAKAPLRLEIESRNEIDIDGIKFSYTGKNNNIQQDSFYRNGYEYPALNGQYGTYRTDNNIPLGFVKQRYEVVQNNVAFKFFDDAIGKDKAIFERAGAWGHGHRIFVAAKLPTNIRVNGDITENYLVFTNAHDGSQSVDILFTPVRLICQNMLNGAIRTAEAAVRFRHTQGVHSKIMTGAEILGISEVKARHCEYLLNQLAKIKVTDEEVETYIAKSVLSPVEVNNVRLLDLKDPVGNLAIGQYKTINDANISTRKANTIVELNNYYHTGIGQKEFAGTMYGLYNAFTGYASNVKTGEGEKRCHDLLYGSSALANGKHLEAMLEKEEEMFVF